MNSQRLTPNRTLPRRDFLKSAGILAAGAAWGLPQFVASRVLGKGGSPGANERLALGIIGVGKRGCDHLRNLSVLRNLGEIEIAALCDADEKQLEKAAEPAGPQATAYRDYRRILARKDIDAVIIATPTHWHGVQFTQAAECGKHIYLESPACATIEEGKAMIAAAKRANIAAQIGAQGVSQPEAYPMHRFLANGAIGRVTRVDCWCAPSPVDDKSASDGDPPPELDYDLWLGPLRWRPYNPRFAHGNFRWLLESGGGQICNLGAHVMSCALHWLDVDAASPVIVEAQGTSPSKGLWDAAVEMKVVYTFKNPDWVLTWNQPGEPVAAEERKAEEAKIAQPGCGAVFRGEAGEAVQWGGDEGVWVSRKVREWVPPAGEPETLVYRSPGHYEDWFEGIKTGERILMNVEAAVAVANLCNLGNLAFMLERKLEWDRTKGEIVGDDEARRLLGRPQRFPFSL
jgi:predicted dehydrogenase